MHAFTQQELQKKQVDDAFAVFFEALKLDTVEDPEQEIINNSKVTMPRIGVVRYLYTKDGQTLVTMDITADSFTADLYGGIHLEGNNNLTESPAVYIDNQKVATLELVLYENTPTPVFRFDDGTTYAITGVLLVDPLIDFLLEYVFSTE